MRPGFAVRLPALAFLTAWLGPNGLLALAVLLGLGVLAAWWARLGEEPGGRERRVIAMLLLAVGALAGLKSEYLALHEVWAGLLLALGGGLHRPGRWRAAWLPVALALAIREHALPFVLLLAALAAWRRDWRELAAWLLLIALFAIGLGFHLQAVGEHLLPGDRPSPSWLAFRGLGGWTGNVVESSVLHLLPAWLAAPLALLPLVGWAGWKTGLGSFYALLFLVYGLLFMIAGRDNNFYWALVVTPAWFVGYAFLPMALRSLLASVRGARAEYPYGHHATSEIHKRLKRGDRRDFDLYETIDKRVARGENYWHAALSEQRGSHYPTKPFVAVRTPMLAWGYTLWGLTGWRVVAIGLWFVTVIGTIALMSGRTRFPERLAAAVAAAVFGAVAFLEKVGLSHEIVAGLFLSSALVVYRPQRWWPSLPLSRCSRSDWRCMPRR